MKRKNDVSLSDEAVKRLKLLSELIKEQIGKDKKQKKHENKIRKEWFGKERT